MPAYEEAWQEIFNDLTRESATSQIFRTGARFVLKPQCVGGNLAASWGQLALRQISPPPIFEPLFDKGIDKVCDKVCLWRWIRGQLYSNR